MMDIYTINHMNRQAAAKAARQRKEPFGMDLSDIEAAKRGDVSVFRAIPNLGPYLPRGWKRVRIEPQHGVYEGDNKGFGAFMVDASGFGAPGEPALTIGEFADALKPGLAYAIVESGQFQVKIGAFKRREAGLTKEAA